MAWMDRSIPHKKRGHHGYPVTLQAYASAAYSEQHGTDSNDGAKVFFFFFLVRIKKLLEYNNNY